MKTCFADRFMAACVQVAFAATILVPGSVGAYGPSTMYTPPSGSLAPGALYGRAMQASNGKMYATFEQYTTGVASFPIFESTDSGRTWSKVGDVKDTHKGVGMRWEPFLYQLPQAIGGMPAGTLLAAGLVLPYDRSSCEIDMYKSGDSGRTWTYVSTVAVGTQATPGSDPVWEPFLLVANDKLYCFYSDERDASYSQKLVHQSTSDGLAWSTAVNDVAISGQRPGMAVVARMPNGNYLMTYEIVGLGGAYYKTSSNIDSWNASDKGTVFDSKGSSPYCVTIDQTIILSSAGSSNLFTNSNNGAGSWTQVSSPIGSAYSRGLVALDNGRLFLIGAGWNGSSLNSVTYADMAFGCTPSAITPAIKVDDGDWRYVATDTVGAGESVVLGPQPVASTGWSWSGPNGFTATTREVTLSSITTAQAGTYTATYTNASSCKSTQKFTLVVKASTTSVLTVRSLTRVGSNRMRMAVDALDLNRMDNPAELRISDIRGIVVHRQSLAGSEVVVPNLKTGIYLIDITQGGAMLARRSFFFE